MALLGRRRDWVRLQGRANAALMLLARDMDGEFVEPAQEKDFAVVRGRTQGCTFELSVAELFGDAVLQLRMRHFHAQHTTQLDGEGCKVPDLDPEQLRPVIEDECFRFAASDS